jgi:hypothetical protein
MTQKEICEAKGFNWNEKTQKCTMPKVGIIKMSAPRGPGCDGTDKRKTHGSKLKLSTLKDLLKASAKPRRKRRAGSV